MNEYDITEAFRAIENELIASMIRNMDRHRAEEDKDGKEWSMWQAEQLKSLEKYKVENQKKYQRQFKRINEAIEELIWEARERGSMEQEIEILEAIQNGFKGTRKISRGMTGEFFKLNERKLEALIKATTDDMERAEVAILRMANDQYRKTIFNAQVYANSGAGTYEKAVDMATKDMLAAGLNCVVYANGARHTLSDYADMAIRTASKRAYLQGEGEKRQEWGISTVIVNKRGNPCPKCLPFVGKVLIDDVWSGGKPKDGPYPLMSTAVALGLYHPRCKDGHTTYFKGISTADDTWTKEELEEIGYKYQEEQKLQYAERQAEKYGRMAKYSLEPENQKKYREKEKAWHQSLVMNDDVDIRELDTDKGESNKIPYEDVTKELLLDVPDMEFAIEELQEFVVDGVTYSVDGVNVKQNNSKREIEVVELLQKSLGKTVRLVPEINGTYSHIKTPDYMIGNQKYDLKELTGTSKDAIRNAIHKKQDQADNFVIDITKCPLNITEIHRQAESVFSSYNTKFVNTIMIIQDDKILRIMRRK